MHIVALKSPDSSDHRSVIHPETIAKLVSLEGASVSFESGIGHGINVSDKAFAELGLKAISRDECLSNGDLIITPSSLTLTESASIKKGSTVIGMLNPFYAVEELKALCNSNISAVSMEFIPRITRAQKMDVLSSQANLAGYAAVLEAAQHLNSALPMMMTAAGTIPAAKVLVLGAGVAGLQAMATAKRLGAIVSAYDVRASSADEVKSMGATFLDLGLDEVEGAGGYAREMTPERAKAQQDALKKFISASDVVITTAAVPGRKAPTLITTDMMSEMKPGAIIVDLAAESGGNVDGSVAGQDVVINVPGGSITLIGCKDLASQLAVHASKLYAQNVVSLLTLMTAEGVVTPDEEDEVVQGSAVVFNGEIRNAMAREALNLPALATGKGE